MIVSKIDVKGVRSIEVYSLLVLAKWMSSGDVTSSRNASVCL